MPSPFWGSDSPPSRAHLPRPDDQAHTRAIISIVDPIAADASTQAARVALFGRPSTMDGGLWGRRSGVEIFKAAPGRDRIHCMPIRASSSHAKGRLPDRRRGRRQSQRIATALRCPAILRPATALTGEFSNDETTSGFPDRVARLHIDAIVEYSQSDLAMADLPAVTPAEMLVASLTPSRQTLPRVTELGTHHSKIRSVA